jgi:hypothetical protein
VSGCRGGELPELRHNYQLPATDQQGFMML